ncbi:MAG: LLM class flavin-dependent oxidoreductase [Rhodobacter sp.]|nr:LLM class flavin-dependent oxidoreductase [Rhodobacter sp.]
MLQRHDIKTISSVLVGDGSLLIDCGEVLLNHGCRITSVVTANPEIQAWATNQGITVQGFSDGLAGNLAAEPFDWLFSIANSRIIPDEILGLAQKGAINFFDGPLPRFAGANAPVRALMNRETEFGVTWHMMETGDSGCRIAAEKRFEIVGVETAYSLNAKCYTAGLECFGDLVTEILADGLDPKPHAPLDPSSRADDTPPPGAGRLDFNADADQLVAQVRALDHGDHWNPLWCPKIEIGGGIYLVQKAEVESFDGTVSPGTVVSIDPSGLLVATRSEGVRLIAVTDQLGKPIDLDTEIPRDEAIPSISAAENAALANAMAPAVASDRFWRPRLQEMQPLTLPLQLSNGAPCPRERTIAIPSALSGTRLVAAIAAWANAVGDAPACDIAFKSRATGAAAKAAPGYLCDWVPLRADRRTADKPAPFGAIHDQVAQQLEEIVKAAVFACDLVARDPRITGFRTPDIGLADSGSDLITGTCLTVVLPSDGTEAKIVYDESRVDPAYLGLLVDRLEVLAKSVAKSADNLAIDRWALLPEAERALLLSAWNRTKTDYDRETTIHQAFEAQAARTPDSVAVAFENAALTYAALDARANQVANVLRDLGVGPGTPVGLCLRRSPDLLVAAFGILKAGGAYVPLDPEYPQERLAHYVNDSGAAVIVTQSDLDGSLPNTHAERLLIDVDPRINAALEEYAPGKVDGDGLAYLIYTSGSTGTPKGVMVTHRNVANFFAGMDDRIGPAPQGVWLAVTSLSFDISVLELFYTLSRGYKVVIASDADRVMVSNCPIQTNDRKIDFGLFFWGNDDGAGPKKYQLLLDGAKFADANGFNAVWTPERHFHAFGGPYPNPSVTGAAVAAVTKNISVRAGSCVAPLHHTVRIAEEWAVVDNLTNGRAGLAVASGWMPDDFVLRPENAPPNNKLAMFDAIEKLRRLWRGDAVEFPTQAGEPFAVVTQPRPVSSDLPIWVTTAGNPDTWKEAGAIGANVLTHLLGQSIEEVAEKIKIYRAALREAGFDPADHTVTLMLHTLVGADRDRVRDTARQPMKDYLRSAVGLIKQYAWAFPAFKRPKNVSEPFQIDLSTLSEDELDGILDFAFQRYFEDSGLFGTVEDCLRRVETLKRIGVDEIACLIDYGIPTDAAMEGLKPLAEVRRRANAAAELDDQDYSLAAQILRHGVTHLQCTPSMARMLVLNDEARLALGRVTHLLIGGEPLSSALAKDLRSATSGRITNMYGPTETTIWSMTEELADVVTPVPIGTPIANTQAYVLDDTGQPVPIGIAGELFIAGDGVTKGYWRRDKLTEDRFLPMPFTTDAQARMYRTGDLVRWRADGKLEFLGRTDDQVKIRGHRIELGEIEAALEGLPGIRAAVVVVKSEAEGDMRLAAFVTASKDISEEAISASLSGQLPAHMLPSVVTKVDAFPLTPNKKVDRKALVELATTPGGARPCVGVKPGTTTEKRIADVWSQVLGVTNVTSEDNFFALGGHSLLAVQAHRKLRTLFPSVELSIIDIFSRPTLKTLAEHIDGRSDPGATSARSPKLDRPEAQPDRMAAMSKRRMLRARREMERG